MRCRFGAANSSGQEHDHGNVNTRVVHSVASKRARNGRAVAETILKGQLSRIEIIPNSRASRLTGCLEDLDESTSGLKDNDHSGTKFGISGLDNGWAH